MSLLVVVVVLLLLLVQLPKLNFIWPHTHSQTLTNNKERPGRRVQRALPLSIVTRSWERNVTTCRSSMLVLLLLQLPKWKYIWRHKHSQTLTSTQERRSTSLTPCAPHTSFEYCNPICREINVTTYRSSSVNTSSRTTTSTELYMTSQTLTNNQARRSEFWATCPRTSFEYYSPDL